MSIQRENVIPFIITSDKHLAPVEAELAYVVGVVGDKIKKGGIFKKTRERLTQVSKFYWRLKVDNFARRLILIDSLGLYGGGTGIQDLPLSTIESHINVMYNASSLNAFTNGLNDANNSLVLSTIDYLVFDQYFTKTTLDLAKRQATEDMIDTPLILPSFEDSISNDFLTAQTEITRLQEIQDLLKEMAQDRLAEINEKTGSIEREFADRITRSKSEVADKIESYEERMNNYIDSDLEKANDAIYRMLSKFEASTLLLTGAVTPIQKDTKNLLNNLPSTDNPKFQSTVSSFLNKAKSQTSNINEKVKEVENQRRQLEKALKNIAQTHLDNKQKAVETYETNKNSALSEVDELQLKRDRALSTLLDQKDSIKRNTDELIKKIETVIKNRYELAKNATANQSGNIPNDIIISSFLVKFRDKDKTRYFVIPPLIRPRGRRNDYPFTEMDSAISGGKDSADQLAAEIVFNRRLKSSFDALKATNYIATGEFAGAVRQGLAYLLEKKMMNSKTAKKINDLLKDLDL